MSWNASDIPSQSGKTAIVTGANSGIGLIAARELARNGASVIVACRDTSKGDAAVEQMRKDLGAAGADASFTVGKLDLASLDSVREFSSGIHTSHPDGFDLLINNAGVMATPKSSTADGFELQFGTNHLGHFALTGLLFDLLDKVPDSRVVTLSSNAHKPGKIDFEDLQHEKRYHRWKAYSQSKLANLMFSNELSRRIVFSGLDMKAIAAHPGYSKTNLSTAGNAVDGGGFVSTISKPFLKIGENLIGQSAEYGALPTLYAATVPDLLNGSYIGPDGMGEMRGHPVIVTGTKASQNLESAERLWKVSEELTGVTFPAELKSGEVPAAS
jgi:NAD(P)-dependent dehydrogenase (short-subunit alcohol dehydrogenase family)